MPLDFYIEGDKQLSRRFRGMVIEGKNWKSTFKDIGKDLTGLFSGPVFETKGRVIGERWKERKKPAPWPLLNKTGKMKGGFKYNAQRDGLEVYNITDYFKYHQSKKPRRKLPRRVMMKIDDKRRNDIVQKFHKDAFNKLGYKTIW